MKEILTQLFGDAVTDDAMKQFNAELGKKFVAKADFNAKVEEVKTLKGEKKTLEDDIAKLNENANGNEDVKKELEALKAKIDADAKQAVKMPKKFRRNLMHLLQREKPKRQRQKQTAYLPKRTQTLKSVSLNV